MPCSKHALRLPNLVLCNELESLWKNVFLYFCLEQNLELKWRHIPPYIDVGCTFGGFKRYQGHPTYQHALRARMCHWIFYPTSPTRNTFRGGCGKLHWFWAYHQMVEKLFNRKTSWFSTMFSWNGGYTNGACSLHILGSQDYGKCHAIYWLRKVALEMLSFLSFSFLFSERWFIFLSCFCSISNIALTANGMGVCNMLAYIWTHAQWTKIWCSKWKCLIGTLSVVSYNVNWKLTRISKTSF